MEQGHPKRFIIYVTLFLFLFFTSIIILAFIIFKNPKYDKTMVSSAEHVQIENFSTVAPNIPKFYQLEVESNIWQDLISYNNTPDDTYTTANIRDNTYQEESAGDNTNTSSFIVDIPSLQQSFKVSFNWQSNISIPDEYLINISCPYYTDVIYQDSNCRVSDNPFTNLYQYLPATLPANNETVELKLSASSFSMDDLTNRTYLNVDYLICDEDTNYDDLVKNRVEAWLKERYIDYSAIQIEYNPHCGRIQVNPGEPL